MGADEVNLKLGKTYDFDFEKLTIQRTEDHDWVPLKIEIIIIINYSFAIGSCIGLISLILEIIFSQELRSKLLGIAVESSDYLLTIMRQTLNKIKRN